MIKKQFCIIINSMLFKIIINSMNNFQTSNKQIDKSSLSRFDISRRLVHANYKQFYIHEKYESLRIKIKSNRSKFADDSNAKSFKCVTTLSRTRKEKKEENDDEREKESIKIRTKVL